MSEKENVNKYRNKKTGKIVLVKSETFSVPTTFHFVYKNGRHIETIADWAFGKQYEKIKKKV